MGTHGQDESNEPDSAAVDRRKLLKAAVGTGVAIAAYSAPAVSGVPAYGLTTTVTTDGLCYAFGWSSNNPNGKGWMKLKDQPDTTVADTVYPGNGNLTKKNQKVLGPNRKETNTCVPDNGGLTPSGIWADSEDDHSGTASCDDGCTAAAPAKGPLRYTWTITNIAPFVPGTFDLTIYLEGSVNGGGTTVTVEGLPAGYCLSFYNSGRASQDGPDDKTLCGYATKLIPLGQGTVTMNTRTTGFISPLNAAPAGCDNKGTTFGKIYWHFDVVPCP